MGWNGMEYMKYNEAVSSQVFKSPLQGRSRFKSAGPAHPI
jgi:hypothetical protein